METLTAYEHVNNTYTLHHGECRCYKRGRSVGFLGARSSTAAVEELFADEFAARPVTDHCEDLFERVGFGPCLGDF